MSIKKIDRNLLGPLTYKQVFETLLDKCDEMIDLLTTHEQTLTRMQERIEALEGHVHEYEVAEEDSKGYRSFPKYETSGMKATAALSPHAEPKPAESPDAQPFPSPTEKESE